MISLTDICKDVRQPGGGRLSILRGVCLEVADGESVAVLGRSGAGKTTLLNIIGLIDSPSSGEYRIDGASVVGMADNDRARLRGAHFGYVFQSFFLLSRRTALANVVAPLYYAPSNEYRSRLVTGQAMLAAVGLAERADALPTQLSGGEQQRVAIARSLCRRPQCILADEPTGALDVETSGPVLDLLFGLGRDHAASVIVITHDKEVARRADRIVTLANGVIKGPTAT